MSMQPWSALRHMQSAASKRDADRKDKRVFFSAGPVTHPRQCGIVYTFSVQSQSDPSPGGTWPALRAVAADGGSQDNPRVRIR